MEEALRKRLVDAGIAGGRVYWTIAPQEAAFPRVTLQLVSGGKLEDYDGFDALAPARIQLDCWAVTMAGGKGGFEAARALAKACLTVLETPGATAGTWFGRPQEIVERAGAETTETRTIFRRSLDLRIWSRPDA